jgi:glycosyltransferase involved in cell wall biosynthesis
VSRNLRVVVNAISARMGGAATHLPNFLHTAGPRFPDDEFIVCVNSEWRLPGLPPNVRLVDAGSLRNRLAHAVWDQWGVARTASREGANALLSLLNFGPVRSPVPHVVLERNPVYFCPPYLATLRHAQLLELRATRALVHAVMRGAQRVVTPSAAMRDMIRACYPHLDPGKFRVIPHGFGEPAFRARRPLPDDVTARMAGSAGVRLLYVSHAAPYKGIEVLLEASRILHDEANFDATAWLTVSRPDWPAGFDRFISFISAHGLDRRVRLLGRIPHDTVQQIYEAADLFIYPSLCESFGFPMVEAMASGLPIIAADVPLDREMCADAAVYYSAQNPAALAQAIIEVTGDAALREALRDAGRSRAHLFSWEKHVDDVMSVVREVAAKTSSANHARGPE